IGPFGILVLKDFGSVLSMQRDARGALLAALREIYDGHWARDVGTGGGTKLVWDGKLGMLFAATGVIDSHHTVLGAMGDRSLFSRLAPVEGKKQFLRALDHVGAGTKQMRKELTEAVGQLFAGRRNNPRPINEDERERIGTALALIVRLRGTLERDYRTRDIKATYAAAGTARPELALQPLPTRV